MKVATVNLLTDGLDSLAVLSGGRGIHASPASPSCPASSSSSSPLGREYYTVGFATAAGLLLIHVSDLGPERKKKSTPFHIFHFIKWRSCEAHNDIRD